MNSHLNIESLHNVLSYLDYRNLISNNLKQGISTGDVQSDEILHYTKLNDTRMNRLDKTMTVDADVLIALQSLKAKYTWIVLSEGWCGDAAQILPLLNKMAQASDKISLQVVLRDENEDLMNQFLTNGAKSIPKLIILDQENNQIVNSWGPRPQAAIDLVQNYKKEFGVIDETLKTQLQKWYLDDKGISTQKEIIRLML